MARLITFGSSDTYGHYLELNQTAPSPLAWPSLLGTSLGIDVINNATPGSSNLEILLNIFKFKFLEDDIVVVGWTHTFRDFLIEQKKKIGPWTPEAEALANLYSNKDMAVRSGLYISHAELYLDSKNLKQQHFFAPKTYTFMELIGKAIKPEPIVKLKHYTDKIIIPNKDTASDGNHPGPKSHLIAAKRIYELLK
jgi:hypothetical protein